MKRNTEKAVRIVFYDADGRHETKPCTHMNVLRMNYSVPFDVSNVTITFCMWFGDEDTGHAEEITVPFVHSVVPV